MVGILRVMAGPDSGRLFSVADNQVLTIGRGRSADTNLHDPLVSRLHCKVGNAGGKVVLTDAGSASGTRVNDEAVQERELESGDVIQVGETRIAFTREDNSSAVSTVGEFQVRPIRPPSIGGEKEP